MDTLSACALALAALSPALVAQAGFDGPERRFSARAAVDSEVRETGVSLGGLGTGSFALCTDGSFRHVSIGPVQPPVAHLPDTFLELDVTPTGDTAGDAAGTQRRALVLGGAGGLPGIARLRYRGIFPRAFLEASEPGLPVRAEIEAWTPFVPHDVEASSLPAAAFDVVLENTSPSGVTATIALEWPADPALPTPLVLEAAAGPAGRIERGAGRVAVSFELAAGAAERATLVVAWDAPAHRSHLRLPGGAVDAARVLLERHDELKAATRAWQALLFDSDLPEWYAERLCNDLIPLVTSTRLTADGAYTIAESAAGLGGILGTMDQRLIAHVATQAFFPELDREELARFAAWQWPNGEIAHHLGSLDGSIREDEGFLGWPDLAASFVCQVWQHQRWTGDAAFADGMAGHVEAALRWLLARDADGDGIADGGSTFDYRPAAAGFVYTASISLAAFEAGRRFADERGDAELAAACTAGAEKARAALVGRLWNGRWFARSLDAASDQASSECFLGQLAGEWYAGTMGWPALVPAALRDRALESLVELNGAASPFLPPLDVRADGSLAATRWGWLPHAYAFYAAPLIDSGRTDAALLCMDRLDRMLVGPARDPWNVGLYYDRFTGRNPKPDYGWYMSTPASWWTLAALSGVVLDVPAGELRLAPRPPATRRDFKVPVFTPALTATLSLHDLEFGIQRRLRLSVLGVHGGGPLLLRRLILLPPLAASPEALDVAVSLEGVSLPGGVRLRDGELVFDLDAPATLESGATLEVVVGDPESAALGIGLAARQAARLAVLENEALRVELDRDDRGLRRLTIVDRQQGGEAIFDVTDLFRIELPAPAGGKALSLLTSPASTRRVSVLSATHAVSADEGGQVWTLEQELELHWPTASDATSVTVQTEIRLPAGRAALLLRLRLRGEVLAPLGRSSDPSAFADFPRLDLLDPAQVGAPLVLHAEGTSIVDAARHADWSGEWTSGPDGEPITVSGPMPRLSLRWVSGSGLGHRLVVRGDRGQHLQFDPACGLEKPKSPGGWWTSGAALEISLR